MFCLFPVISSGRLFHSRCSADCSSHPGGDFITDYYCKHKTAGYDEVSLYGDTGVIWPTFLCWLGGSVAGLLVTNTGFINGPFATGVFENSSLGLFVSFPVSMAAYRLTLMMKPVRS